MKGSCLLVSQTQGTAVWRESFRGRFYVLRGIRRNGACVGLEQMDTPVPGHLKIRRIFASGHSILNMKGTRTVGSLILDAYIDLKCRNYTGSISALR